MTMLSKQIDVPEDALQNASAQRVSDRAKKIATALVMIADLFPATDPFGTDLRQIAVSLIRDTYVHDYLSLNERRKRLLAALEITEQALSVIEVTDRSGMVSSMNATIIDRELRLMHQFLLSQYQALAEGHMYSERDEEIAALFAAVESDLPEKDTVTTEKQPKEEVNVKDIQTDISKGQDIKDIEQEDIKDNDTTPRPDDTKGPGSGLPQKDMASVPGVRNVAEVFAMRAKDRPMAPDVKVGGSERRNQILEALHIADAEVSIQDITKAIDEEVSTKTVQRELTALMARGLVTKNGDRRWSKYALSERGSAQLRRLQEVS